MECILNSRFYQALAEGRAVELWEDNQVVNGWTMYTVVSLHRDEATILAHLRMRGDRLERRIADGPDPQEWVPLE